MLPIELQFGSNLRSSVDQVIVQPRFSSSGQCCPCLWHLHSRGSFKGENWRRWQVTSDVQLIRSRHRIKHVYFKHTVLVLFSKSYPSPRLSQWGVVWQPQTIHHRPCWLCSGSGCKLHFFCPIKKVWYHLTQTEVISHKDNCQEPCLCYYETYAMRGYIGWIENRLMLSELLVN